MSLTRERTLTRPPAGALESSSVCRKATEAGVEQTAARYDCLTRHGASDASTAHCLALMHEARGHGSFTVWITFQHEV